MRERASTVPPSVAAGHEVGELACRRYPGGHLIAHDDEHQQEALEETRQVIDAGTEVDVAGYRDKVHPLQAP